MTVDELNAVCAAVTYQPGWTLRVYDDPFEGVHLQMIGPARDAYHPERTILLDIHSPIPPCDNTVDFLAWLSWRVQRVASHEAREWLRYRGRAVSDPHKMHAAELRRRTVEAPAPNPAEWSHLLHV